MFIKFLWLSLKGSFTTYVECKKQHIDALSIKRTLTVKYLTPVDINDNPLIIPLTGTAQTLPYHVLYSVTHHQLSL